MSAEECKAKGNEAFKAQKFDEAIEHFTNAINADPSNHVLYSNRSASYASLHKYGEALKDAEKCIELSSAWGKGYSRKGAALIGLNKLEEALATYEEGLKHEPDNAMLKSGIDDVRAKLDGGGMGAIGNMFSDPNLFAKIATNPQTMGFLQQPDFVAKLNQLQRDPSCLNLHLSDPRIMQVLGMLMGVNVQSGADFMGEQADRPEAPRPEPEPEPMEAEEELSEEEQQARALKKEAEGHKEQGNAAYKAKRFDEAIEHYNKAREVMPSEMTYLTNLAAVFFEQGEYRKSADTCAEAVKVGREHRADYKNVAKAYGRMGNALAKLGELDKAIKAYEDSMLENRTEDVEKRLKACKKERDALAAKAYVSEELAQLEKDKGNALFKEGKFVEAISAYSEVRRPTLATPFSPLPLAGSATAAALYCRSACTTSLAATLAGSCLARSRHRCWPGLPPPPLEARLDERARTHWAGSPLNAARAYSPLPPPPPYVPGDEAQPCGPRALLEPSRVLPEADGVAARRQGLRQVHPNVPHFRQGVHAQGRYEQLRAARRPCRAAPPARCPGCRSPRPVALTCALRPPTARPLLARQACTSTSRSTTRRSTRTTARSSSTARTRRRRTVSSACWSRSTRPTRRKTSRRGRSAPCRTPRFRASCKTRRCATCSRTCRTTRRARTSTCKTRRSRRTSRSSSRQACSPSSSRAAAQPPLLSHGSTQRGRF